MILAEFRTDPNSCRLPIEPSLICVMLTTSINDCLACLNSGLAEPFCGIFTSPCGHRRLYQGPDLCSAFLHTQDRSSGEQRDSARCGVLRSAAADDLMAGLDFPGDLASLVSTPTAGAGSRATRQRQHRQQH